MAEIKSTLELALERTKKFALSEKDKEEIKQKEIQQKALSLFHRYRDNHLHLHEIQKELERMEKKVGEKVQEELLSLWIESLSPVEEDEKVFKGIETLKRQNVDKMKGEFRQLLSQYQQDRDRIRHEVESQLLETLRKKGIDGNAVKPNIEGSDLWKEELLRLGRTFHSRLEGIKEQLRVL